MMKISKEDKTIMINSAISFFAIILSCFLTYVLTKSSELETRRYESDREALAVILKDTLKYSNYSTVDWNKVDELYYHPYNDCDFEYKIEIDPGADSNKIIDTLCKINQRLDNAKNDFRKLTTEARIIGSDNINQSLYSVEKGFDEVFNRVLSDTYYGRTFVDKYNEVLPKKFSELEESIINELRK